MPHPLPLLPERNHQSPVVPSLSRPDRSLLTPDAGHRRLPGLTTMQSFPRCCPTCPLTPPSHLVREIAAVHFLFHRIKVSSFIIAIKTLYAGFSQPGVSEVFRSPGLSLSTAGAVLGPWGAMGAVLGSWGAVGALLGFRCAVGAVLGFWVLWQQDTASGYAGLGCCSVAWPWHRGTPGAHWVLWEGDGGLLEFA